MNWQIATPIVLILISLGICWTEIIYTAIYPTWRNVLGLIGGISLAIIYLKSKSLAFYATALYLIIGILTILSIEAGKITTQIYIGPITTPPFNLLCFGILCIWFILNFNKLIEDKLDRKEARKINKQNRIFNK